MAPAAGVQVRHLKLTDLVYVDDTCLLAGNPQNLQALIDALVDYCSTLRMEISVAKTKVMVVSKPSARSLAPNTAVFTCNGLQVGRVDTFIYLGLHYHASGGMLHCYHPSEGKCGRLLGCSAAEALSTAVWLHSQPRTLTVTKYPGTISAFQFS